MGGHGPHGPLNSDSPDATTFFSRPTPGGSLSLWRPRQPRSPLEILIRSWQRRLSIFIDDPCPRLRFAPSNSSLLQTNTHFLQTFYQFVINFISLCVNFYDFTGWRHFVDNDISWTLFLKKGDFLWTFPKGDFSWTLLVTFRGQF